MVDYKPKFRYTITIYEQTKDEMGNPIEAQTLSHTFYGDSVDVIQAIIKKHADIDTFFAGSLLGKWNNIILKNEYGELEINKK